MNFFKSSFFNDFKIPDVLSLAQEEADDSSGPETDDASSHDAGTENNPSNTEDRSQAASSAWNFGGLVKSIAEKSEGVLQAYRKDLEEFKSGLQKETQIIAEVASHAVKDFSLETGASKAQESIESVGQVIEDFSSSVWRGTADIIAQGKDAMLKLEEESQASGSASSASSLARYDNVSVPLAGGKYSRFEVQVRAMQHDSSTYCDEPEDVNEYASWRSTFSLPDKKQDIDSLLSENTFLQELFTRFVPYVVEEETFWTRYFYKLHKLRQTEEARENLVKRASALEEEELGWGTDEEVDEDGTVDDKKAKPNEEAAEYLKSKSTDPPAEGSQHATPVPVVSKVEEKDAVKTNSEVSIVDDQSNAGKDANDETERNEEDEDLGWEVADGADEDGSKRSSNSEASWDVPEVPKEEIRKRLIAKQDQDEEELTWDDDEDDDTK